VLPASGNYVADSLAILLGIVAVTICDRAGGRSKAPIIVALINSVAPTDRHRAGSVGRPSDASCTAHPQSTACR
jgi:hypothetical protein